MRNVFVVQHGYEQWGYENVFFIGVYETQKDAEAAVSRLKTQPGFRHWPDGFSIDEYPLGKDHWTEGFVTVVSIHVPVLGDCRDAFEIIAAEWMPGDVYRLIQEEGAPPGDLLAFKPGQVVACEERTLNGQPGCLVAVRAIEEAS
jgi:hypothetical protein